MSVDVKAVVMTENKDVFKILSRVKNAVVQKMYKESGIDNFHLWNRDLGYSWPQAELYENRMLTLNFQYKGENRNLHIFFTCNNDYDDEMDGKVMKSSKIILSLGAWGHAVEIMESCLDALSSLGKTYITNDDCADMWRFYKCDYMNTQ